MNINIPIPTLKSTVGGKTQEADIQDSDSDEVDKDEEEQKSSNNNDICKWRYKNGKCESFDERSLVIADENEKEGIKQADLVGSFTLHSLTLLTRRSDRRYYFRTKDTLTIDPELELDDLDGGGGDSHDNTCDQYEREVQFDQNNDATYISNNVSWCNDKQNFECINNESQDRFEAFQETRNIGLKNQYYLQQKSLFTQQEKDKRMKYTAEFKSISSERGFSQSPQPHPSEPTAIHAGYGFGGCSNSSPSANYAGISDQMTAKLQQNMSNEPNHPTEAKNMSDLSMFLRKAQLETITNMPVTPPLKAKDPCLVYYASLSDFIRLIFANDLHGFKISFAEFAIQYRNLRDPLGNTLLLIAVRLALQNDSYYEIVKCMLQMGCDPRIRNSAGWSAIDLVIQARHVKLTTTLFEFAYQAKILKLKASLNELGSLLERLPDFYVEVKWKVDSAAVPFIKYFAPSDTLKLWKIGNRFRLDSTLAGFSGLKVKRRHLSVVFTGAGTSLMLFNRTKGVLTDMQEPLAFEEKKFIVQDLLQATSFHSSFDVAACEISKDLSAWTGKVKSKRFAGLFDAEKFAVKVEYKNEKRDEGSFKEEMSLFENVQNYFAALQLKKQGGVNQINKAKKSEKKQRTKFNLWLSKDYPIRFEDLIAILDVVERSNPMLLKLNQFLRMEEIRSVFVSGGFPVKISIPLSFAFKTTVDFSAFKYLNAKQMKEQEIESIFEIDPKQKVVSRMVAQKTLENQKKRMIMANIIIA